MEDGPGLRCVERFEEGVVLNLYLSPMIPLPDHARQQRQNYCTMGQSCHNI